MEVTLDGKKIILSEFDDARTLKSELVKNHKGTIPSFFRITDVGNMKFTSSNFLDDLTKITFEDMKKPETLQRLKSLYPAVFRNVGEEDISFLWAGAWLTKKGYDASYSALLQSLDPNSFANETKMKRVQSMYTGHINSTRDKVEKLSRSFAFAKEELKRLPKVDIVEKYITKKIVNLNLEFETQKSLTQIFDAIAPSRLVPFVMYYHGGKSYFKLFEDFKIPDESWIYLEKDTENRSKDLRLRSLTNEGVLVLHVFSLPKKSEDSKQYQEPNKYTTVYWYPNHLIESSFAVKPDFSVLDLWDRIVSSLETVREEITNQIYNDRQVNAHVVFDLQIQRESFTHFLLFDRLASYFINFDEARATNVQKKRMLLYFEAESSVTDREKAFRVTITEKDDKLFAGISNAENEAQIETTVRILSRLLGSYLQEKERIEEKYRAIYFDSIPREQAVKKQPKKNLKTGDKLSALKAALGEEYIKPTSYSKFCSQNKQPRIITAEEANKLDSSRVLQIKDVYMTCDHEEFKYPNMTEKGSGPCCYKKPRESTKAAKKAATYIVGAEKELEMFRKGELRVLYQRILGLLKIEKVRLTKTTPVYPYLRMGVAKSEYSFVECLAYGLQKTVPKIVNDAVKFLETNPYAFSACKQEFFDTTKEWVINNLKVPGASISPSFYFRLFSLVTETNVIAFTVEDDEDAVFVPRHESRFIPYPENPSWATVVIFVNTTGDNVQCELLIKESNHIISRFKNDPLVEYLKVLYYSSRKLYKIKGHVSEQV